MNDPSGVPIGGFVAEFGQAVKSPTVEDNIAQLQEQYKELAEKFAKMANDYAALVKQLSVPADLAAKVDGLVQLLDSKHGIR